MGVGPNYGLDKGFLATGTAAYAYGDPVIQTTNGLGVAPATVAGSFCIGICQENIIADYVKTGKAIINVRLTGLTRVTAGAAITVGARVAVNTAKRVVTAVATNNVIGIALTPAASNGDVIEILLTPGVVA